MKIRLSFALVLSLLLFTLILPTSAGDPPTLTLTQTHACEPGQELTLTLSLPNTTLAGGFLTLQYDADIFSLTEIALLQATDALTLTYAHSGNSINILLDAAQNVQIDGAFVSLTFACSEETQPGTYPLTCTVPNGASFYALQADGSTYPLYVNGCTAEITVSTPVLPACPARYLACQETNAQNGNVNVRVCALIQDQAALSQGNYGFICSVTDQSGTLELTLDGQEILNQIQGGGYTYTANELGGCVYTATLNIPAQGEVRITLSPFVRIDGQMLYGGSYTLIYQDGLYIKTVI